ncbi:MAG: hypothetical protein ABW123_30150, partial [Cystobacter sp.]
MLDALRRPARLALSCLVSMGATLLSSAPALAQRQIEKLDRGMVAVPANGGGILVSWRLLSQDSSDVSFNVYRDGSRLTAMPLTNVTNYRDTGGSNASTYTL